MKVNSFEIGKSFAPKVDIDFGLDASGNYGSLSIGELYYETDRWNKREDVIRELKGCWEKIK